MSDHPTPASFSENERAVLHSMAEMFQDKDDRDQLRKLLSEGATLAQIITAYKSQRWLIGGLRAIGGMVVILGTALAALKGLGIWPK